MKKNIIFTLSLLTAAASFGSSVESDNIFGVLKIATTGTETVIGVPWVAVGSGTTPINISDLVLTSNLLQGDQLYYYDSSAKKFEVWQLNSSKVWVALDSVTGWTSDKVKTATTTTLPRGSALIVKFGDADGREDSSIYLSGQYADIAGAETTILHPTTDQVEKGKKQIWNLIAPPSTASGGYDLNTATWNPKPNDKDYIIVEAGSTYYWNKSDGKWGTYTWGDPVEETWNFSPTATIPQGKGAWYVAVGARTGEAVKCTWQ